MRRDARLNAMQLHCSNGIIAVSAFIDCQYGCWRLNGTAKASHRLHEEIQLGMRVYAPISPNAMLREDGCPSLRLGERCMSMTSQSGTLPGKFDAALMAVEDVRPAILPGVAEMHWLIAMVLAMRSAPALRARMHELMHIADDRPFLLSRFQGTVWIEVGAGNSLRVLRKQVSGLPSIDLDQVLRAEPTLKDAIQASIGETGANATAMRLLAPILDTRLFPARADMEELRRWAPLVEYAAYQSGARAMIWLDGGRLTIVKGRTSDARRMLFPYWSGMHVMAHLVFIASEPDASPWLGDMARQFHWNSWTPSF